MSLKEVKGTHPKAKHGTNWFRPDDLGRAWYFWAESRMRAVYNYVLPEQDHEDASIISIVAVIDLTDTTSKHAIDALVARWGEPLARDVPVATVRYYGAFGVPKGDVEWRATSWQDDACDTLVTVLDKPRISPLVGRSTVLTVAIDSISKSVAYSEARSEERRKKADEATRP